MHCVDEGKTIDYNYYIENCLELVVQEIWKQRRLAGTKGIKLVDYHAQAHIHCDAFCYLTEESINIMAHPQYSLDRCTM